MTLSSRVATGLGYDPAVMQTLTVPHVRALAVVAWCALPALVVVSASAAYGTWLASDVVPLAAVVGVSAGLYLVNLLRLSTAGGGVAPHEDAVRARSWSPRVVPLVILAVLGGFFAQPLLLASLARAQDPAVDELRGALVKMHEDAAVFHARDALREAQENLDKVTQRRERVVARLAANTAEQAALQASRGQDGVEVEQRVLAAAAEEYRAQLLPLDRGLEDARRKVEHWTGAAQRVLSDDVAPYREHLAHSHFLLRRVQLTWEEPVRAAGFSLMVLLLLLLPWLASASVSRTAVRAYETARWSSTRALVETAFVHARAQEEQALRAWKTFEVLRAPLFVDAPYNTQPRGGGGHG